MVVTGRFVLLVALGIVPVVIAGTVGVSAWGTLAAWLAGCVVLLAIDIAIAASPRALHVERVSVPKTRLGTPVPARLFLTNRGSRQLRGLVRDAWEPSAGAPPERMRLTLPAGERRALTLTLTPWRRGERSTDSVTVRSFGPLRLGARQATLRSRGTMRVIPPFLSRRHLPSKLARLRELDGATALMVRGQGTEFDSLRDYVRGDDVRSIDWRASARRMAGRSDSGDHLVVRTWRPERDRRVIIIVDTGRTAAARIGDEPRLDTGIESSLLLAALANAAGDRVDLILLDRRVRGRVRGITGDALLGAMVDVMADVEPELVETDWSLVPGLVREITTQRSLVVLLTAAESPGSSAELLTSLPDLTQKHLVLVASVTDPALDEVRTEVLDRESVYLAAAAERALLDTRRVTAAIHRVGADSLRSGPEDLPPNLADRYLDLKKTGRL